jgi:hypothetical protein
MVVGINVLKEDLETLSVRITLSGLTVGERYDVMRLQLRGSQKPDGTRIYERELPDRRALWSSVAHRVGWEATAATHTFRDFECPKRPTKYYVVKSTSIGPFEWDFGDGTYPVSRGVLDDEIVHFNGDLADLHLEGDQQVDKGHVLVRSTAELSHFADACLVEMDGPTYTARVNEFAVMHSQYPVIVSDSREARRGSMTLMTHNLGQYNDLRRVVFPESGRITPFVMNSGGDTALLLDDMRVVPLDVSVEQVTQRDADMRYVHIAYVEIDPTAPLLQRIGCNDQLTDPPNASFTISDLTPARGQVVTIRDTSTGQGDTWEFSVGHPTMDNHVHKFFTSGGAGGHQVRWPHRGRKIVKLRFGGSGEGFNTRTRYVDVH